MAGDWIKMRCNLGDDPAVIQMAESLKMDEDTIVGKLHRLWAWADGQLRSCNACGVTLSWIDRYTRAPGFAQAMVDAGWLEESKDGVAFPNFERHMSKTAKQRALTSIRTRQSRYRKCNDESVTQSLPEKRREEKNIKAAPLTPLPPSLDCDEFKTAWEEFKRHRTQKRAKLTPIAERNALKKLDRIGKDRAIAALEHTMSNGWTGIFEPKEEPETSSITAGKPPKSPLSDWDEMVAKGEI